MLESLTVHDFMVFMERFSKGFCAIVQDIDKIKEAFSFVQVICFMSWTWPCPSDSELLWNRHLITETNIHSKVRGMCLYDI